MSVLNEFTEKINSAKVVGIVKNHEQNMSAKLLYIMLLSQGYSCALVTDQLLYINDDFFDFSDQQSIDRMLKYELVDEKIDYCIVAISVENIQQNLFEKLNFYGGVFAGLEKNTANKEFDFQAQRDVVKSFFDQLPKKAFALSNIDDKNGEFMLQNTKAKKHTYSQKSMADYKVKILEKNHFGSRLNLDSEEVWVTTKHESECIELLCTYAAARLLEIEKMEVLVFLSSMTSKRGSIALALNKKFQLVSSTTRVK